MINLTILAISLLILQGAAQDQQQVCTKLHMGTEVGNPGHKNDIIAAGVTNSWWKDGNLVVSASKNLDFFYLSDEQFELKETDISLFYDNNEHVRAQHILKREKEKGYYTVEVSYNCDSYGANIINFKLEIVVPNCGSATLDWKKLCGNPFTIREGLTMEMAFGNFQQVIVKNGKPLNPKFFDRDIGNFAFELPVSYNTIKLEMYMNPDDIANNTNSSEVHAFGSIEQNHNKKFTLNTFVSTVRVDSDQNVVTTEVVGNAVHGAAVTNATRETVDITFNCTENGGSSTIELDVVMPSFQDVTLFFVKRCPEKAGAYSQTAEAKQILVFWITVAVVLAFCYLTYRNIKEHGKTGISVIPFYDELRSLYIKIKKVSKPAQLPLASDDHELSGLKHTKLNNKEDDDFRSVSTDESMQHVSKVNTYGTLLNE